MVMWKIPMGQLLETGAFLPPLQFQVLRDWHSPELPLQYPLPHPCLSLQPQLSPSCLRGHPHRQPYRHPPLRLPRCWPERKRKLGVMIHRQLAA